MRLSKSQRPVNSGFNAQSTAEEVISGINLSGKTAIVTGGYAGIGLETVKHSQKPEPTSLYPREILKKQEKIFQA